MSENELYAQQLNEEAVRIAARMLAFAGVNQNQDAEIIYANLHETLIAVFQEIERRGFGFDEAHPDNFDIFLGILRKAIDSRLRNDVW